VKRLLCFFDGTWNVPDGRQEVTNVVKLTRIVPAVGTDGVRQTLRYIEGIGTDPGDSDYAAFLEGVVGIGIELRILEAYRFLADRYAPGDEIYIFGFSRGAFQARSLAGLIGLTGLSRPGDDSAADAVWEAYRRHRTSPDPSALERVRASGPSDVRIRCLGVWDTVGNLGVPVIGHAGVYDTTFHDTALGPNVDVGLHALAIDEPRGPFRPTMWTRPQSAPPPVGQHTEQVWFAGSHANVGGGFPDASLSDISLNWMAERVAATTGLSLDLDHLRRWTSPDPLGELVSPTTDGIYRVSRAFPFVRLIHQNPRGVSPWRRSVMGMARTSRLPSGLHTVGESLHPSVVARYDRKAPLRYDATARKTLYRPRPVAAAIERPDART
jgi:uncharacterized protein (DUF2235 family)